MDSRPLLHFGLHGLSDREEVLFKSCMNIISLRTRHRWVWHAHVVNLLVVADDTINQLSGSFSSVPIICIGNAEKVMARRKDTETRHVYLPRPLRPIDMLACVDRQGDFAIKNGNLAIDLRALPTAATAAVRLRRWPPVPLLSDRYRTRLATLLTGRPVTLSWLKQRSGVPEEICTSFLSELEHANLLESTHVTTLPSVIVTPSVSSKMGLLGRIRQRLGLSEATAAYV